MEHYIFFINTLIGFFGALAWDILQRERDSNNSPKKFDLSFFLADNKSRLIVSFLLSILVMLGVYFNIKDAALLFGKDWTQLNALIYLLIGAAPDLIISFAKRRVGFLQPEESKGYIRKETDTDKNAGSDDNGNGDGGVIPKKGF